MRSTSTLPSASITTMYVTGGEATSTICTSVLLLDPRSIRSSGMPMKEITKPVLISETMMPARNHRAALSNCVSPDKLHVHVNYRDSRQSASHCPPPRATEPVVSGTRTVTPDEATRLRAKQGVVILRRLRMSGFSIAASTHRPTRGRRGRSPRFLRAGRVGGFHPDRYSAAQPRPTQQRPRGDVGRTPTAKRQCWRAGNRRRRAAPPPSPPSAARSHRVPAAD